jgi:hypothetical protein
VLAAPAFETLPHFTWRFDAPCSAAAWHASSRRLLVSTAANRDIDDIDDDSDAVNAGNAGEARGSGSACVRLVELAEARTASNRAPIAIDARVPNAPRGMRMRAMK